MSELDEWRTPPDLFAALDAELHFDADAAATPQNALCPDYWTADTDGLAAAWAGRRVYCNPPYGAGPANWARWVEKAYLQTAHFACPLVCLLLPADVSTAAWHRVILTAAREVRLPESRICYRRPDGTPAGTPRFASAIVIFSGAYTAPPLIRSWDWRTV